MHFRGALQFLLLLLVCAVICSINAQAQSSTNPRSGCPSIVPCDDFKEMTGKKVFPKVVIEDITFNGPVHLPAANVESLVTSLTHHELDGDHNWLEKIEEAVLSVWQDQGYFKAEVKAQALPLGGDATYQHFSIALHINEGGLYRFEAISFRSSNPDVSLVFPPEELRKLIPLQVGDILSTQKIGDGVNAMKELYGNHGYIDFTADPVPDIDESTHKVSIRMELDQQKQFRIDKIDVSGLDSNLASLLEAQVKPGDPFNGKILRALLNEHNSALPPLVPREEIILRRNFMDGTVDIKFGFRSPAQ
jgi:outer membrane protein assembly factor BamA